MFLVNTIKRVFEKLPEVEGPEEGWYQWMVDQDDTDPCSRNYNPSADPAHPANPAYDAGEDIYDASRDLYHDNS